MIEANIWLIISIIIAIIFFVTGIILLVVIYIKRHNLETKNQLNIRQESQIKLDDLITYLGSIDNIKSSEATINKIKIFVHDVSKIDQEKIKSLKYVTGAMQTSYAINIIVGNQAQAIKNQINQMITNKKAE